MAKYMLIMRGTDESVAKMTETPFEQMLETVGRFNEEMIRAGVLVAAEGLDDPSQGVVVDIDEFPQDNEWIIKERTWRERTGQL